MPQVRSGDLHFPEIKVLAARFSADQIDQCIELASTQNANPCIAEDDLNKVMDVLAKAKFVKTQMGRGMTQQEAVRELGRRIRAAQGAAR